jgi:hypothetical protein
VLTTIRTAPSRALSVAEHQAGPHLTAAEAGAVDEGTRPGVLADERAHRVDDFLGRRETRLGVRIVLVHEHETHGRLLT